MNAGRTCAAIALVSGLCASTGWSQPDVFALDLRAAPNRLLRFPVNAPANTQVATVTQDFFAIDFDRAANTLYGITFLAAGTGTMELGTIDQATGAFTSIGPISGAGAAEANWCGLSMDPTTNTMYAAAVTGAGLCNLYTIDLTTGATTLVAPIAGPAALYIDIAIDVNGQMYAHDIAADTLVTVNKATGATTVLGPTGMASNFAQGMDFDWTTNTLYATIYTGGGTGAFCSLSTTTGAATVIASTTAWNSEMEMAVKAAPPAAGCYANCDGSTTPPILNVGDFSCFLNSFAAGDSYANCDNSTTPPVLNVGDFSCFLNSFAAGCT
jgi:hypothetical protein